MSKPRERVTELEQRVEELEATVEGLTEELVDKAERIRLLEKQLDDDAEARAADGGTDESDGDGDSAAEETAETPTSEGEKAEDETTPGDDIIVA